MISMETSLFFPLNYQSKINDPSSSNKLGDPAKLLHTIRGIGYRWDENRSTEKFRLKDT